MNSATASISHVAAWLPWSGCVVGETVRSVIWSSPVNSRQLVAYLSFHRCKATLSVRFEEKGSLLVAAYGPFYCDAVPSLDFAKVWAGWVLGGLDFEDERRAA